MDCTNGKEEVGYCKLCYKKPKSYTCPRCGIDYCSLNCYKSEVHLECSESFYKQCVEEELKCSESDPETKQKMLDILKRLHEEDMENDILVESEDDEELDSDDETNLLDLETRLRNVDLDNADEVWAALNHEEKQEFEALIKSGEASKLLPPWVPWWTHKKPLIESLEITEEDIDKKQETEYPIIIDVQTFNKQIVVSPKICFNIMNVIYTYAYIALYYNGDYLNCAEEATHTVFSICENLRENKIFDNEETALKSVVQNIKQNEHLSKDVETLAAFITAGNSIFKHPKKMQGTIYTCAALSELWRLLSEAQKEMAINKHKRIEKKLLKRHSQHSGIQNNCFSKKIIFACLKKLEFYVSWLQTYGKQMYM